MLTESAKSPYEASFMRDIDRAFNGILAAAGVPYPPALLVVRDLGSVGRRIPGLIVLGERDIGRLAQRVFTMNRPENSSAISARARYAMDIAVAARVLGHEVGHCAIEAGRAAPFGDPEVGADYWLGRYDGGVGRNAVLGGQILRAARGETLVGEEHLRAYAAGFADALLDRADELKRWAARRSRALLRASRPTNHQPPRTPTSARDLGRSQISPQPLRSRRGM